MPGEPESLAAMSVSAGFNALRIAYQNTQKVAATSTSRATAARLAQRPRTVSRSVLFRNRRPHQAKANQELKTTELAR